MVVFGFDDRIARHSIRTLVSLSRNSRQDLDAVILARRWRPWTMAYYRSLELEWLRIRILDMSAVSVSGDLRLLSHTTAATMDRLYLPLLLPSVERVMYLEVRTWAHPRDRETILAELVRTGAPATLRTFNAGILVMDLRTLRSRSFVRTTVDLVRRFGVNDQLAINLYTRGEFEALDPSWNLFAGQDTLGAPRIIHWPGPKKPWNSDEVPYKRVWNSYARAYDPLRQWLGALPGRQPVNPIHRIDPRDLMV